jgi:hypothetical protein
MYHYRVLFAELRLMVYPEVLREDSWILYCIYGCVIVGGQRVIGVRWEWSARTSERPVGLARGRNRCRRSGWRDRSHGEPRMTKIPEETIYTIMTINPTT